MQIGQTGSSGRKQVVDLNLVPFIDLMSVCIIFLLITAVWTQVSMIQLGASIYSNKTEDQPIPPPPFVEIILRVDVLPTGFRLVAGKESMAIPAVGSNKMYNKDKLISELQAVKNKYPDKVDAIVSVRDNVQYKYLIEAMDAMLTSGFSQVSITTTGVE